MIILVLDGPKDHTQHRTMDLDNLSLKLIIPEKHIVLKKKQLISEQIRKTVQGVMYSSKGFSSKYM